MHSDDGMQQGVQQAASLQKGTAALAAEGDQGQGSVVCGRFKPAPDGSGLEQNDGESPSKMSRQGLGTRPLFCVTQPDHCWQQAKSCAHPLAGRAGHPTVTAAILVAGRVMQELISCEADQAAGKLYGGFHRCSDRDLQT